MIKHEMMKDLCVMLSVFVSLSALFVDLGFSSFRGFGSTMAAR